MRKGQATMLYWLIRLGVMIVAVAIIVIFVRTYTNRDIEAASLHRSSYLYRIYYDDIIMYKDATGRVYPGVVDANKFTDTVLDDVFYEKESPDIPGKISSRIIITPQDCSLPQKTIYNDQHTFNLYFEQVGVISASATLEEKDFPVTIKENAVECPALMQVSIVRPST